MFGKNPIMKIHRSDDGSLDVHSIFYTIQGEGPHAGRAAVFVRLHGCSLACSWCDTEFDDKRTTYTPSQLMLEVIKAAQCMNRLGDLAHLPLIVITGGEPMRQDLGPFVKMAKTHGWHLQVETAGIHALSAQLIYSLGPTFTIVCSPKLASVHPTVAADAIAFKYIIDARQEPAFMDGLPLFAVSQRGQPTHSMLARPVWLKRDPHRIYVQPLDPPAVDQIEGDAAIARADREKWRMENLNRCIFLVKTYGYRLSLQQHKIMGVE